MSDNFCKYHKNQLIGYQLLLVDETKDQKERVFTNRPHILFPPQLVDIHQEETNQSAHQINKSLVIVLLVETMEKILLVKPLWHFDTCWIRLLDKFAKTWQPVFYFKQIS